MPDKFISTFKFNVSKVIILDAGHGGIDGGAVGKNGTTESKVNLQIALRLRELLEEQGIIVILTRDEDVGLYSDSGTIRKKKNEDLRERRKMMNGNNADLFISIHMNSFPESKYYGAQTFYPENSEESELLAKYIQEQLKKVLNNKNHREAKCKKDVYILKECSIPTVLVECGFLSNSQEEKLLLNNTYQEKVAWAMYVGILKYFEEID
ncbi:N-acetylmuramoyl-L-alanine amidase CwlD [Anaeromicrobium sediminis]|uniref:N-acetylmuramoyl-L-alanine amidase CwlD n=2 Tax=Anaeromicrobium sediminis TaxID=1478221 RepID=A0A267MFD8_9FIRM|nr:N-acetylmuramoyl-L-alanine amidase CwlD [Anaeromicrobium sediminis]